MAKLQALVDSFLSGDFSEFTGNSSYHVLGDNYDRISFNDMVIVSKIKNNIFIENTIASTYSVVLLLNCFPGILAEIKSNTIYINGMQWDGSKANLSLFIN